MDTSNVSMLSHGPNSGEVEKDPTTESSASEAYSSSLVSVPSTTEASSTNGKTSPSNDPLIPSREDLLSWIARLEDELKQPSALPPYQRHQTRVLADVVRSELRHFLSAAAPSRYCRRCLHFEKNSAGQGINSTPPLQLGQKHPRSEEHSVIVEEVTDELPEDEGGEAGLGISLYRCLEQIRKEKRKLEKSYADLYYNSVEPLQQKVEQLEEENQKLTFQCEKLEEEGAALHQHDSNCHHSTLVEEVRQLRKSEALLKSQLEATERTVAETAKGMSEVVESGAAIKQEQLPRLQELVAMQSAQLREKDMRIRLALIRVHEVEARCARQEDQHNEQLLQWKSFYFSRLEDAEKRSTQLKERVASLEKEKEELEQELQASKEAMPALTAGLDENFSSNQRKSFLASFNIDQENGSDLESESIRIKYIKFWYDGHQKIADLEQYIQTLEQKAVELRTSESRVAQFTRQEHFMTQQLTNLALTAESLREQERELKAELAGIQVERDCLVEQMIKFYELDEASRGGSNLLPRAKLVECSKAIREAAKAATAASAAVVADPKVMEEAARLAHERKTEVERLEKQKEKLLRFIESREQRVASILTQEVLNTSLSSPQRVIQQPIKHLLEQTRRCAQDIFQDCRDSVLGTSSHHLETAESTKGNDAHSSSVSSFLSLQEEVHRMEEHRDNALRVLSTRTEERDFLKKMVIASKEELSRYILENRGLLEAFQVSNQAYSALVGTLNHRLFTLEKTHASLQDFTKQAVRGLGYTYELLKNELSAGAHLRSFVVEERENLRRLLLQRSTNENGTGFEESHQKIVDALGRLGNQVQEAASFFQMQNSSTQTKFLLEVVKAVKAQESKLAGLQTEYESRVQNLSKSLSDHVTSAHAQWDTSWQKKVESAEQAQRQLVARQQCFSALYQQMEVIPASGFTLNQDEGDNMSVSLDQSLDTTIKVMESFMEHLSLALPSETPTSLPVETPVAQPPPTNTLKPNISPSCDSVAPVSTEGQTAFLSLSSNPPDVKLSLPEEVVVPLIIQTESVPETIQSRSFTSAFLEEGGSGTADEKLNDDSENFR